MSPMSTDNYHATRFTFDPRRDRLWKTLCDAYFSRRIRPDFCVLELGAGYGHFINHVRCARRLAVDQWQGFLQFLDAGVQGHVGNASDLGFIPDASVDFAFASNLFEHLTRDELAATLDALKTKLRPGGSLTLLQPNYRYAYREYFDDYTHVSVFSDRSLCDLVSSHGFQVAEVRPPLPAVLDQVEVPGAAMADPALPAAAGEAVCQADAPPRGLAARGRAMSLRHAISRGAVLLFLVLAAHQAAKPLHLDNMDFPAVAEATTHSGKPVYYRGEENPLHSGLYHPPLYIYTLAGWFRVFGSGPAQARMFGAICALLQGWIALQILSLLFGAGRVRRWSWLFWPFYLLNPYTLQSSAIADIDSTIYGPLLGLVLFSILRISWKDGRRREDAPRGWEPALVALALTVALWAKVTTVLLLFPFLFLLLAPRLGWKRALLVTAGVSATAVGAFALTYYLYGVLTGLDVGYTFQFLGKSVTGPGRLLSFGRNLKAMLPFMVKWTGLLPWLSLVLLLAAAARRWWTAREPQALYAFWLLSLAGASVVYYCGQVMSFGGAPFKYTFVFWALLSCAPVILLAWLWESNAKETADRTAAAGPAVWLLGLATGAVVIQDVFLNGYKALVYPQSMSLWVPAGVALAGLLAWTLGGQRLEEIRRRRHDRGAAVPCRPPGRHRPVPKPRRLLDDL